MSDNLTQKHDFSGEFPRWIGASYLATKKQIINR